jgi:hypothetical protein
MAENVHWIMTWIHRMSMRFALAILGGMALYGQALPTGFVRGVLVENRAGEPASDFSVRAEGDVLYLFHCDGKTWIEREHERVPVSGLHPGELVEVVSDRDPNARYSTHYARMVQVITQARPRAPVRDGMYRFYRPDETKIGSPASNFTYAGIVLEIVGERMVLRTRFDGEKIIYLRPDTRCLQEGSEVDAATIRPNTRVFIEAGKDANHDLEAFRVVWGAILEPAGLRD